MLDLGGSRTLRREEREDEPDESGEQQEYCSNSQSSYGAESNAAAASVWQTLTDEESGESYYWNTATGETTWERPAELGPIEAVSQGQEMETPAQDAPQSSSAPSKTENSKVAANQEAVKHADGGGEETQALSLLGGYESDSASEGSDEPVDSTKSAENEVPTSSKVSIETDGETGEEEEAEGNLEGVAASKQEQLAPVKIILKPKQSVLQQPVPINVFARKKKSTSQAEGSSDQGEAGEQGQADQSQGAAEVSDNASARKEKDDSDDEQAKAGQGDSVPKVHKVGSDEASTRRSAEAEDFEDVDEFLREVEDASKTAQETAKISGRPSNRAQGGSEKTATDTDQDEDDGGDGDVDDFLKELEAVPNTRPAHPQPRDTKGICPHCGHNSKDSARARETRASSSDEEEEETEMTWVAECGMQLLQMRDRGSALLSRLESAIDEEEMLPRARRDRLLRLLGRCNCLDHVECVFVCMCMRFMTRALNGTCPRD